MPNIGTVLKEEILRLSRKEQQPTNWLPGVGLALRMRGVPSAYESLQTAPH